MTTAVVFGLYLLGLLALAEVFARLKVRSLDDYLLSGREHGTLVTSAAIVATVIGAGSTLGAAAVAYYVGISAGWYLVSAAPGLLLLALTLAPELRRLSVYTVPEYLTRRYGEAAGVLADLLGLVALVLFLAAQLYAMGNLLATFTPLGETAGLALSAGVLVLYTWRGGNWAIHWSDTLQLGLIVVGTAACAWFAHRELQGLGALASPPPAAGFEELGRNWFHPLDREVVLGAAPLALGDTVLAWVIMSTTWHFAMQSTAQRVLSSRDEGVARRSCLIAAAATVPLGVLFAYLGMSARVLFPDLEAPPAGVEMAEQIRALPALVEGVLPPVAAGVVLAALVAVIMSTCDSALLGAVTLVVKDLRPRLRAWRGEGRAAESPPAGADEARTLARSRRLVLGFGGAALVAALLAPGLVQVLEMVAAIYCVALFVPLLGGYLWGGASEAGAVAAMLASGGAGLAWRAAGLEASLGVHMLNVVLPVAVVGLLAGSFYSSTLRSST